MRSQTAERRKVNTSHGIRQNKDSLIVNKLQETFNVGEFLNSTKQQQNFGINIVDIDETQIAEVDLLDKYRSLVSKAQQHLNHKSSSIYQNGIGKKDFFITGTKFQTQQLYQVDDKDIQLQNREKIDDLRELRKMIRSTKRNMSNFGDSLYDLNKNVQTLNTKANYYGMGVKEYVFDDLNSSLKRKIKK